MVGSNRPRVGRTRRNVTDHAATSPNAELFGTKTTALTDTITIKLSRFTVSENPEAQPLVCFYPVGFPFPCFSLSHCNTQTLQGRRTRTVAPVLVQLFTFLSLVGCPMRVGAFNHRFSRWLPQSYSPTCITRSHKPHTGQYPLTAPHFHLLTKPPTAYRNYATLLVPSTCSSLTNK
jgi:hypothetical protein